MFTQRLIYTLISISILSFGPTSKAKSLSRLVNAYKTSVAERQAHRNAMSKIVDEVNAIDAKIPEVKDQLLRARTVGKSSYQNWKDAHTEYHNLKNLVKLLERTEIEKAQIINLTNGLTKSLNRGLDNYLERYENTITVLREISVNRVGTFSEALRQSASASLKLLKKHNPNSNQAKEIRKSIIASIYRLKSTVSDIKSPVY